jgi:hypothetical protein
MIYFYWWINGSYLSRLVRFREYLSIYQTFDGRRYLLKVVRLDQVSLRADVDRRHQIGIARERRIKDYRGSRIELPYQPAQIKTRPVNELTTQYVDVESSAFGQAQPVRQCVG